MVPRVLLLRRELLLGQVLLLRVVALLLEVVLRQNLEVVLRLKQPVLVLKLWLGFRLGPMQPAQPTRQCSVEAVFLQFPGICRMKRVWNRPC